MKFSIKIPKLRYQAIFLAAYLTILPNIYELDHFIRSQHTKNIQYSPLHLPDVNEIIDVNQIASPKENELEQMLKGLKKIKSQTFFSTLPLYHDRNI